MWSRFTSRGCHLLVLLPEHQCQVGSPVGCVTILCRYPSIKVKSFHQSGLSFPCTVTRASMSRQFTSRVCHLLVLLPEHQCEIGSPVGYDISLYWYPSINVKSFHQTGMTFTWTVTRASMSSLFTTGVHGGHYWYSYPSTWWQHQMEIFSALLALCAGNSPVTGEFPSERPVTRSFDVSFDLRLNKRFSKQSWGWWFETPWHSLWRDWNAIHDLWYQTKISTLFKPQFTLHLPCKPIEFCRLDIP